MTFKALPIVLLVVATVVSSTGYAAVADETPGYTMEDVTACSQDAMRICKDKLPDVDAIEACMKAHFDELEPKCKERFKR
jgi:hypothetical protein